MCVGCQVKGRRSISISDGDVARQYHYSRRPIDILAPKQSSCRRTSIAGMSIATRDDIPAIKSSRTRLEEFFYSVEVPITMSASALASAYTDHCTGNRKADQIFEQVLPTEFLPCASG